MKILNTIFSILFLFGFNISNALAIEEAKYTVLLDDEPFQVREYAPHILAETIVKGSFDEAGSNAFRPLFNYISGENISKTDITMTSPVTQEATSLNIAMTSPVTQQQENGNYAVSFMMPNDFTLLTLPSPKNPSVRLRQVPAQYIASIQYSGLWNETGFNENKVKLNKWIKDNQFEVIGNTKWARYDPPFMPWFLRRNEILIPITKPANLKPLTQPIKSEAIYD